MFSFWIFASISETVYIFAAAILSFFFKYHPKFFFLFSYHRSISKVSMMYKEKSESKNGSEGKNGGEGAGKKSKEEEKNLVNI